MQRNATQEEPTRSGGHCPFVPGSGMAPPHLAGREVPQQVCLGFLRAIQAGRSPGRDLVLYGPRGNGKTAMLVWMESEAKALGIDVRALAVADLQSQRDLVVQLSRPANWFSRLGAISWKGLQWRAPTDTTEVLAQVLQRQLHKAPLAILVDEAHTLDVAIGRSILAAAQRLRNLGAPLLLVLAGTPGLLDHLGSMKATFWERNKILPFDRLQDQDSRSAIRVPFEAAGRTIPSDVLERAVAASHGYPYFLQIWGEALWGPDEDPTGTVTESDIERARTEFESERNLFYSLRCDELRRMGLLNTAAALANAYGDKPTLSGPRITGVLEESLRQQGRPCDSASVAATCSSLVSVGYIWDPRSEAAETYKRGIPSLMDFVLDAVRQS